MLGIENRKMMKQAYVASLVEPYIDVSGKPRLIEPPRAELKKVQKRIKKLLGRIEVPENVFSGIKGRSYIDNASFHTGNKLRYLFKTDLSAFFPSISRNAVYVFFRFEMQCSPDVAGLLANFTTINLEQATLRNRESVYKFLAEKKVKCYNHLISGAPTSQILSYLVNHRMFDEMQVLADNNNITMTIYVDDVTFSSENKISNNFKDKILRIAQKYNYQISKSKVKSYSKQYPKLVTGVIIDANGSLTVKNSLRSKIIIEHDYLRVHPENNKSRQRLRGLVTAARQVKKDVFPTIYDFTLSKTEGINQVNG